MFDKIRKAISGSERRRRRSSHEQEFTHRNPPAHLPPRRSDEATPDWRIVLGQAEYQAEYALLIKELFEKFAIEGNPYDLVLESMNAIENEMNRNGGCNWKHDDY